MNVNTIKLSEFENTSVAKIDINGTTVAVFKVDDDYYAFKTCALILKQILLMERFMIAK